MRRDSQAAPGRVALLVVSLASLGFVFELEVARLRLAYENGNPPERHTVIRRASRLETSAILPLLRDALEDEDSSVSLEAADALIDRRDEASLDAIVSWFDQTAEAPRIVAARAVGRFRLETERPRIERMLGDGDAAVRLAAVRALDELGDAGRPLSAALEDADASIRVAAAVALGRLGDPSTEPSLVAATRDVDARVRAAAITAIAAIPGADAITVGLAGLDDRDLDVVESSIRLLGRSGVTEVASAIGAKLDASDSSVATAAIFALARLDYAGSLELLAERLPDARLANAIERAIGAPPDAAAASACVRAMARLDADEALRSKTDAAMAACARAATLDADAESRILSATVAHPSVSLAAALGSLASPDAARLATSLATGSDAELSRAALSSLDRMLARVPDGRVVEPLVAAIPSFDAERRVLAYRVLGASGATRALGALRRGIRGESTDERDARLLAIARLAPAEGAQLAMAGLEDRRYGDAALASVLCESVTSVAAVERMIGSRNAVVAIEALACGLARGRGPFVTKRAAIVAAVRRGLVANDTRVFDASVEAALLVDPTALDAAAQLGDSRGVSVRAQRALAALSPCAAEVVLNAGALGATRDAARSIQAVFPDGRRVEVRIDSRGRLPRLASCAVAFERVAEVPAR